MRISRTATISACGAALVLTLTVACSADQRSLPADPARSAAAPEPPGGGLNPAQLRTAYDLGPLLRHGIDGKGQTIVIVDSFGSPTITRDLAVFDRQFGLPAPPSLRVIQPAGRVPAYRPTSTRTGEASETIAGRGGGARDGAGREHSAGGDTDPGGGGAKRIPADRHGRGVRHPASSRWRDQPELRRDRADLPLKVRAPPAARALPASRPARPTR
jgi:hypothetical protein